MMSMKLYVMKSKKKGLYVRFSLVINMLRQQMELEGQAFGANEVAGCRNVQVFTRKSSTTHQRTMRAPGKCSLDTGPGKHQPCNPALHLPFQSKAPSISSSLNQDPLNLQHQLLVTQSTQHMNEHIIVVVEGIAEIEHDSTSFDVVTTHF